MNFFVKQFLEPWKKEVTSPIILMLFLGPVDLNVAFEHFNSFLDMFVRERGYFLDSDNGDFLRINIENTYLFN